MDIDEAAARAVLIAGIHGLWQLDHGFGITVGTAVMTRSLEVKYGFMCDFNKVECEHGINTYLSERCREELDCVACACWRDGGVVTGGVLHAAGVQRAEWNVRKLSDTTYFAARVDRLCNIHCAFSGPEMPYWPVLSPLTLEDWTLRSLRFVWLLSVLAVGFTPARASAQRRRFRDRIQRFLMFCFRRIHMNVR